MNTRVSSKKPWLLVILVDSSHSMGADWGDSRVSMSKHVMDAVNSTIYELAMEHCVVSEEVKDRIDLSVLSYGGESSSWALLTSPTPEGYSKASGSDGWVTGYRGVSSENGQDIPYWIEIEPNGSTPMRDAIRRASEIVKKHCELFPESFPPTVINISDGEPTDSGDPIDWDDLERGCRSITACSTNNGNALFCNVHLDPLGDEETLLYPEKPGITEHQRGLWKMSSEVPKHLYPFLFSEGLDEGVGNRRFYVYNADLPAFQRFLVFGTRRTELNPLLIEGLVAEPRDSESFQTETLPVAEGANEVVIDADFSIVEEE